MPVTTPGRWPRQAAAVLVRAYRYTLSALIGRHCRHWPTCSEYTEEAILRHGLWAGGWAGAARICRCGPFGTSGIDLVPHTVPERARWYLPWRYGRWRGVNAPQVLCEEVHDSRDGPEQRRGISPNQT